MSYREEQAKRNQLEQIIRTMRKSVKCYQRETSSSKYYLLIQRVIHPESDQLHTGKDG